MALIVGLDLGSYSVKVVRVEARRGEFDVVDYTEEILGPATLHGEQVPLQERHHEALTALKAAGKIEGDLYVTGIGGDTASLRTLSFPFSDAKKIEAAIPFELESEIPFDIEDVVYSWAVLGEKRTPRIEASGEVKPPETEVMVAYALREAVADHLDLLETVGVDPRHVEFDALALDDLFEGVLRARFEAELAQGPQVTPGGTVVEAGPDAPEPAVALVDVGHRRTSVCIVTKDRVVGAHTVLHGGADATRALAKAFGIALEEAERGKRKEAFIEVVGTTAQFPEQRQISDILKEAYGPIVRRLRQTFQAAMSTQRARVVKVFLTGGGSRVLNLDRHLAGALNVRVERGRDVATRLGAALPLPGQGGDGDVPEAAGALAYALSGLYGDKTRARIDFRSGEFAWRGQLDFVRERASALGIWAAVLGAVFLFGAGVQSYLLSSQSAKLAEQQGALCQSITGQAIDSGLRCLAVIKERIAGQAGFQLPDKSAADHYLEVSRRIPVQSVVDRKVTELDIASDRIRIKSETTDFDAVDKIVAGLKDGECFADVEKGKARNVGERVEFNVTIKVDCQAAPGKPLPETQKVAVAEAPPPTRGGRPTPSLATEDDDGAARAEVGPRQRSPRRPRVPGGDEAEKDPIDKRELLKRADRPELPKVDPDEAKRRRAERKAKIKEQQDAFRRLQREGKANPGAEITPRPLRPGMPDHLRPLKSRDGRLPLPTPPAAEKAAGETEGGE